VDGVAYLLHDRGEDGNDHEDSKEDVLHSGQRVIRLEEGEADEETRDRSQDELGEDIGRCSPVLLEYTNSDGPCLQGKGRCELSVVARCVVCHRLRRFVAVDAFNLLDDIFALGAAIPNVMPVSAPGVGALVDNLEHVFGRVLLLATFATTVGLEVVQQGPGVLPDVAKVHRLAAGSQEEEAVELLEQDSTGLMHSTEHRLSGVGELAKEGTDSPRTLRIEATRRFVEE
jgi:hypothetical protein